VRRTNNWDHGRTGCRGGWLVDREWAGVEKAGGGGRAQEVVDVGREAVEHCAVWSENAAVVVVVFEKWAVECN
jgi:hypothetical protein